MNPLRLTASNLRTYPTLDYSFTPGITAVTGPNGAGKSTLLGTVELALFADGARDLAPATGPFTDRLEITLEFEQGGERYRVRRTYTANGRGKATLDLEQLGGPTGFAPQLLTKETAAATQTFLQQLIGFDRATFNASAFLAQGNSAAWTEASPADRKAVLGAILDPAQIWPRLTEAVATERREQERQLAGHEALIGVLAVQAERVPELHRDIDKATVARQIAEDAHVEAERKLERVQADLAANEAAVARRDAATAEREHALANLTRAENELRDAQAKAERVESARAELARLTGVADRIPELERIAEANREAEALVDRTKVEQRSAELESDAARSAYLKHAAELAGLTARYDDLVARAAELRSAAPDSERCSLCHQTLGVEAREATIANFDAEIAAMIPEIAQRRIVSDELLADREAKEAAWLAIKIPDLPQVGDTAGELAEARSARERSVALAVEIQGYEREAERLPALKEAVRAATQTVEEATVKLVALPVAKSRSMLDIGIADARGDLVAKRELLDQRANELARLQADLERAKQAQTEHADLKATISKAQTELATLRLAERAYGRDGIPALIAENAALTIETEANRVLERLPTSSGTVMRVELRTQKALKTSDNLKETLDILVSDRQSTREFATYSGGERFRVSFALRWALAKLLANRRGADSRLLVIDEPDGLDAGGMDGLAAVLREEASVFEKILIVSHNPLLAEAFPQVIRVESDGEISRLVTS